MGPSLKTLKHQFGMRAIYSPARNCGISVKMYPFLRDLYTQYQLMRKRYWLTVDLLYMWEM